MAAQLPPLTALRCFEAAARCKSFTLAADALCLTPSAVSHQIKSLETFLGMQLFVRAGRSMLLTEAGTAYYDRIHVAFAEIIGATKALTVPRRGETLRISVAPSFANAWLMPRLAQFIRANGNLQIQVFTNLHPISFADSPLDCEIRYGHGRWPILESDLLIQEQLVPLCSPALLRRRSGIEGAEDLANYTLIYTASRQVTWDSWAQRLRVTSLGGAQHLHVDRSPLALEAAVAGVGFALESNILASREIERGELIAPLDLACGSDEAYYLVRPKATAELERVSLFRAWLLDTLRKG